MKNSQKGSGAVIAIIIVVVIAIIGAVGFLVLKKGGDVVSNAAATVVSSAETQKAFDDCKKSYQDEDLCKALSNFVGSKQYQTSMTMNGMTMAMEVDGTKTYSKTTINGKTLEIIYTGEVTYTKDNTDGKWWKQVIPKSTTTSSTDNFKFDTNINDTTTKTTYTKMGQEVCDKLTCNKYKVTESGSTDVQYIWIDTKDHLMRKWMVESKDGNTTATYSYNKKSVDTPSNTKDASPTQNVIPADFYSGLLSNAITNSTTVNQDSNMGEDTITEEAPAEE